MRHTIGAWGAAIASLLVAGCSSGYFVPRQHKAELFAEQAGWSYRLVSAGEFDIVSYSSPSAVGAEVLAVYIEGDGLAFLDRTTASPDPTPSDPLALRLAIAARRGPAVYLARPCQFIIAEHPRNCVPAIWTNRRYAPEVVATMNRAIEMIKTTSRAQRLVLVGYSGGGALAVLVAAQRSDVVGLVTIAANLDLGYWTRHNQLAPLTGSIDPASVADRIASIPQVHFSGSRDEIVPPDTIRAFLSHFPRSSRARAVEVNGFDHSCCWATAWPQLLERSDLEAISEWKR